MVQACGLIGPRQFTEADDATLRCVSHLTSSSPSDLLRVLHFNFNSSFHGEA